MKPNIRSYTVNRMGTEVRVEFVDDPDAFEEVTFTVWNCLNKREAEKQVKAFIRRLIQEATKK